MHGFYYYTYTCVYSYTSCIEYRIMFLNVESYVQQNETHVFIYMNVYLAIYICVCVYLHLYVCVYMCVWTYACIHIYIHIYVRMCKYTECILHTECIPYMYTEHILFLSPAQQSRMCHVCSRARACVCVCVRVCVCVSA